MSDTCSLCPPFGDIWASCLLPSHMDRLKGKRWRKICNTNINQKNTLADILMSDKVDSRAEKIPRVREGHLIRIKRPGCQEDNHKFVCTKQHSCKTLKANG